ncbi:MAG: chitobiase/beta-hexosaminidase C-terminal domain-containing protein [Anaerovoracaceae bacterium]|jgi:hypothetical protein
MKIMKRKPAAGRALAVILSILLIFTMSSLEGVRAKTVTATPAKRVLSYVTSSEGRDVLVRISSMDEMMALAHGANGKQYYDISYTDNLPTTGYAEARGFTLGEYVDFINKNQNYVSGLTFGGTDGSAQDTLYMMADDSNGAYSRSMTAGKAQQERRYVPGLYKGWLQFGADAWEKKPNDLEVAEYKDKAWEQGESSDVILSPWSFSGRTTAKIGQGESSEGIQEYVEQNDGVVKGCLSKAGVLNGKQALTLYIPTKKADLMAQDDVHGRTAYDNFKWIYCTRLDMENDPVIADGGTVAPAKVSFNKIDDGRSLQITMSCDTPGATIYYNDGMTASYTSPQEVYSGPLTIDISGRDLGKDPVTILTRAVKLGCSDSGQQRVSYYPSSPGIEDIDPVKLGAEDVILKAGDGVTVEDWKAWTDAVSSSGSVAVKYTFDDEYTTLERGSGYEIDNDSKQLRIDRSALKRPGMYNIRIKADGYSTMQDTVDVKGSAPSISTADYYSTGRALSLDFNDASGHYQEDAIVSYRVHGSEETFSVPSLSLERTAGRLTISSEFMNRASCRMKKAGTYDIVVTNADYEPVDNVVTVELIDSDAVAAARKAIDAIGDVSDTSGPRIKAARSAYDALTTDKERSLADGSGKLAAAAS